MKKLVFLMLSILILGGCANNRDADREQLEVNKSNSSVEEQFEYSVDSSNAVEYNMDTDTE